jgi:hypothetical protein
LWGRGAHQERLEGLEVGDQRGSKSDIRGAHSEGSEGLNSWRPEGLLVEYQRDSQGNGTGAGKGKAKSVRWGNGGTQKDLSKGLIVGREGLPGRNPGWAQQESALLAEGLMWWQHVVEGRLASCRDGEEE